MINKKKREQIDSSRKNKFTEFREKYGTSNQVLELLNATAGFEGIDRTTLFRWEKVKDELLPKRAILAIKILKEKLEKNEGLKLRIGEPRGLLSLPSSLTWLSQSESKPSVIRSLCGFDPEVKIFNTGGEALVKLNEGALDIAIAADLLVEKAERESQQKILNLGQLSMSPFYVVTTMTDVRSVKDLQNVKIGYPQLSVVPQILESLSQEFESKFEKLISCKTPYEAREKLLSGKIKALVCWDWWVEEVLSAKVNRDKNNKLLYVFANIIGNHKLNIAINSETINVHAFKSYLKALNYVFQNLNYLVKSNRNILQHVGMKNEIVERYLNNMNYGLKNLNLNCILSIWEKESDVYRNY